MRVEEVNAWGSYEQTAKTARAFSSRRTPHHGQQARRRSTVAIRRSTMASFPIHEEEDPQTGRRNTLAAFVTDEADVETGRRLYPRSASQLGTNWSKLFEKASLDGSRHSQVEIRPQKEPEVIPKEEKLSTELMKDFREIFSVYFEDYESDGSFRHEENMSAVMRCASAFNATMPWFQDYLKQNAPFPHMFLFVELCLRGISQVYFQNSPLSGLFILVALFVQSSRVAVHGVIALVCGSLAAYLLGFDKGLIKSGLFGYNAVLVGLALATFDSTSKHHDYYAPIVIGTIIFAGFSSILFVSMGKLLVPYKSPPLTLPFNVATLVFLLATAQMTRVDTDPVRPPALPDYGNSGPIGSLDANDFFKGVVRGIGQVFLADSFTSGLLVLAGITVCSRIAACAAFLGSAVGAAMALATGVPAQTIVSGLYGFNASLSFTAMLMFYVPSKGSLVMGTLAGIMTVASQQSLATLLAPYGLPFMTLPFCVIALAFIILQGTTTLVVAVPLASMTVPEDHLRRVKMLSDGFQFLKDAIRPAEEQPSPKKYGREFTRSLQALKRAISIEQDTKEPVKWYLRQKKGIEKEAWVQTSAGLIFDALDDKNAGHIVQTQFTDALQTVGFNEPTGLDFAGHVFNSMDFDNSNTIERKEFVAFAVVSRCLLSVRRKICNFFDFVDSNGDAYIDFDEIDAALEYLGEPALDDADREALMALNDIYEDGVINSIELTNYVTVAKVKSLVATYQESTECEQSVS